MIEGEQENDGIDISGSYPQPATPTVLHDYTSTTTYSRLAGDRNTYYTLEPIEIIEEKDDKSVVVSEDAVGAQCLDKRKNGTGEVLATRDHNVDNEVI